MKKILGRDVLLSYHNFSETFIIYTDASKNQPGGIISQKGITIAFYSIKLIPAQINYTTTKKELLSTVETLKSLELFF